MTILLLGSQHGDEHLGEKLHAYIGEHHPLLAAQVVFKIGNPKARRQNVRFIESDLNRSYKAPFDTYESRRAAYIQKFIKANQFDLILDLHTTACIQPPCFIIHTKTGPVRRFLRASHVDKIVEMQHPIVKPSLIGVCDKALSIEIANHDINSQMLESLCQDLSRFINNNAHHKTKKLYVVRDLLLKSKISEKDALLLRNFTKTTTGFIPILVGENSYKKNTQYLGFKATEETIITL